MSATGSESDSSDDEIPTKFDDDELVDAAMEGMVETVTRLLRAGRDVRGDVGCAALCYAATEGSTAVVAALLAAGAPVEGFKGTRREVNKTPLILAARWRHVKIVELLLAAGANIEAADRDGKTALCYAANMGRIDVVLFLIEAGAELDPVQKADAPLYSAVAKKHADVVRELLAAGADPDGGQHTYERQPDGSIVTVGNHQTPLFCAVTTIDLGLVSILLEAGANPNILTKDKDFDFGMRYTALMRGVQAPGLVRLLLEAGADPFFQSYPHRGPSNGVAKRLILDSTRDEATRELLKREMNRRMAAALSVMPPQVPLHARQEIMRLTYS